MKTLDIQRSIDLSYVTNCIRENRQITRTTTDNEYMRIWYCAITAIKLPQLKHELAEFSTLTAENRYNLFSFPVRSAA